MEEQKTTEDWRADVSDSTKDTLKILDGESKVVLFLDEGKKFTHSEYGTSIVFEVEHNGTSMNFYVKENNFALLKQIKDLGKLTGTPTKISRTGSKRSDTRYTVEKAE